MDKTKRKKSAKREPRKTVFGIKLPPIEPVDEKFKTILDIDPDFYSLVEGRPIRPDTSINRYKKNITGVFLNRTLQGYLIDEIMRIDREMKNEKDIYETAVRHFEECQYSFDKFLAHDNDKTIVIMRKSDKLAKDVANQTEEHKSIFYELAQIKSKVQYIEETLLILLSFETFLHKSSPILWQEQNDVKLDVEHSEIVSMDSNIYRKADMDLIVKRLSELSSPKLYFESPEQLTKMFNYMEQQGLHFLLKLEDFNSEMRKFLKTKDRLRELLNEELDQYKQKIEKIEEIISWNEEREEQLKLIFTKILDDKIQYLVSSDLVLQLMNYVEYTYEQLIAPNETKLTLLDMTHALEAEYEDVMMDISKFDVSMIKSIEKEVYENSEMEIKRAKEASTLLKDVDKLHRRLKSSFEPSRKERTY